MSPICNSSFITYEWDYQQEMQHVPVWRRSDEKNYETWRNVGG